MHRKEGYKFEIQYTKVADKFLKAHEDVRDQYEAPSRNCWLETIWKKSM